MQEIISDNRRKSLIYKNKNHKRVFQTSSFGWLGTKMFKYSSEAIAKT